jgi:hypothetical protein
MPSRSDRSRWLPEEPAFEVLELSRGAGRELIAKGLLRPREDGIFRESDIVEATVIEHLRPSLGRLSEAARTCAALREEGVFGAIVELALSDDAERSFAIVIDERTSEVSAIVDDQELVAAVRGPLRRRLVFVDLTDELNARLTAFRRRANRGPVPAKRRGRPRRTAEVHTLTLQADE